MKRSGNLIPQHNLKQPEKFRASTSCLWLLECLRRIIQHEESWLVGETHPTTACLHHPEPVGRGSTGLGPIGRGSTGRGPTGRSVIGRGVRGSLLIMSPASGTATVTVARSNSRAQSFMVNCFPELSQQTRKSRNCALLYRRQTDFTLLLRNYSSTATDRYAKPRRCQSI
jgi:hypothetical protein